MIEGWHTLAVCYRKITLDDVTKWKGQFKEAESVMVKREGEVTSSMEKDFTLLGAVGMSSLLLFQLYKLISHYYI